MLSLGFLYRKEEQRHLRGVENVPDEGGSKIRFWEGGVLREVFLPLFFSHTPVANFTNLRQTSHEGAHFSVLLMYGNV